MSVLHLYDIKSMNVYQIGSQDQVGVCFLHKIVDFCTFIFVLAILPVKSSDVQTWMAFETVCIVWVSRTYAKRL